MRVGIVLGDAAQEAGGGFTIQQDILDALLRLRNESTHSFVFLTSIGRTTAFPNEESLSLRLSAAERVQLKWKQLGALASRIGKTLRNPELKSTGGWESLFHSFIRRKLQKNKIEFICYLAPYGHITMEIPYLTIVWDLQHRRQPYFPEVSAEGEWIARENFFSVFLKRASVIVAGTEAGKSEIESFFQVPAERIHILPHPTPSFALEADRDSGPDVLRKYNLTRNYLFYPAQFWSHKNHVLILKALQNLRDERQIHLHAVFAGSDMGNMDYIRFLSNKLQLQSQVHFLGFVPVKDLIELYRHALALTYVTHFGPENLPPLEAFALGCPVIASKVPGAEEQLGDAAILIDPVNEEQLADAIQNLCTDKSLAETLRRRGCERARRFTAEDFVRGLFQILDQFESMRCCWK